MLRVFACCPSLSKVGRHCNLIRYLLVLVVSVGIDRLFEVTSADVSPSFWSVGFIIKCNLRQLLWVIFQVLLEYYFFLFFVVPGNSSTRWAQ